MSRQGDKGFLDHTEILRKRAQELLPQSMREHGIDCWIVFTRETSRDQVASQIGGGLVTARSAFIFYLDKRGTLNRVAIVADYDTAGPVESGIYNRVIAYKEEGVRPHLKQVVEEADPKHIALDYSRDDPLADGLTSGMRGYLEECLGQHYAKRFTSAEELLASFLGRRLPEEISFYDRAVRLTQQILVSTLSNRAITPGKTTVADVVKFLQDRSYAVGAEIAFAVVSVDPDRGFVTGPNRVINRGELVHIDFGIDYQGYKTDIQRSAYVLREGEDKAPADLRQMWVDALKANRAAVAAIKPGATGLDVDNAARKLILSGGYENYDHVTGHGVGFQVHDEGAVLGPDWKDRYGSRVFHTIETGQLYAVEPTVRRFVRSLKGEVSIGLEEDTVVEPSGARYLGVPQTDLMVVR